jgi:hypothetical protein
LTGEKEVPGPGDPNGRGDADVKVYKARVCYELEVDRIKPATAVHIHRGGSGVAGPVVVELKAPTAGSSEGCKATKEAEQAPLALLRQRPQRPVPRWCHKGPAAQEQVGSDDVGPTR